MFDRCLRRPNHRGLEAAVRLDGAARGSAATHILGQERRHICVRMSGQDFFLVLEGLIVAVAFITTGLNDCTSPMVQSPPCRARSSQCCIARLATHHGNGPVCRTIVTVLPLATTFPAVGD